MLAGVVGGPTIGTPKKVWDWVFGIDIGGVVNDKLLVVGEHQVRAYSLTQIDPLFGTVKQKYMRLPI